MMIYNSSYIKYLNDLKKMRAEENIPKSILDVDNINELNLLIDRDDITEEEYQDMVSYIQNKNCEIKKKDEKD
tara:strand:+ start:1620 stop:1838 length:219 start_codon:yes stop_codon:yes gene_type:complete